MYQIICEYKVSLYLFAQIKRWMFMDMFDFGMGFGKGNFRSQLLGTNEPDMKSCPPLLVLSIQVTHIFRFHCESQNWIMVDLPYRP